MNTKKKKPPEEFPLLDITCSSTDCENDLHYYGPAKRKSSPFPIGKCRNCGTEIVDWDRIHSRKTVNVDYTVRMLQTECWRNEWWNNQIDQWAINHARRKGKLELEQASISVLKKKISDGYSLWDGRQTPTSKNIIYYGQHATATCCRKCVQYWHGVPRNRDVKEFEFIYFAELIMVYVEKRLPDLADSGVYVPNIVNRI